MMTPTDTRLHDAVSAFLIVILAQNPDPGSNILNFQDFIRAGQSFIPIFRSHESFRRATRGTMNKPIYEINRRLFVSLLHGPETLILDAGLPDEIATSGDALKRIFPEPFDPSRESRSR